MSSAIRHRGGGPSRIVSALLVFALTLVVACAEVTFKRGATPSTMAADERGCRKSDPADSAFRACMRDKGWFVAGGSEATPSSVASPDRAGEGATAMGHVIDFSAPAPAAPVPDHAPAEPVATPTMSTQPQVPATAAARSATPQQRQSPVAAVVSAPPSPPTASATTPDPAPVAGGPALIGVASWWKFGGTAGGLDGDIAACTQKLGNSHRPSPAATLVTREMGACLRENGWYALGKSR